MGEPFTWPRIDEGLSTPEVVRFLNIRLPRVARELASLSGGSTTDLTPITNITGRFLDMEAMFGGLNSGVDGVGASISGFSRLQPVIPSQSLVMFQFLTGGVVQPTYQQLNGQRGAGWFSAAGSNTCYVFRPGVNTVFYCPFGAPGFMTTTGTITAPPDPSYGFSVSIMAWCRKLSAGDSSSCRMTMGFANNTVVSASNPIPRCGLLGDGAGGYRYGSVNCPDGLAGGPNGDTDIDANAVQPTDLVAPGANWWHTRIKLVPATPTQSARWGAYHNGVLVATFTTSTNFPRGHQGTNDDYGRIEASVLNFSGDTGALHVPELVFSKLRIVCDDILTL